jgi:hypothetical protein
MSEPLIGNCARCRHFHPEVTSISSPLPSYDGPAGECRANPPQLVSNYNCLNEHAQGLRIWPAVFKKDWCSNWAPWPDEVIE